MKAILLAGAENRALQMYSKVRKEALIPINGKPMINYVLEVLCETDEVGQIIVVGLEAESNIYNHTKCKYIVGGETLWDNLYKALRELKDEREVLVVTSDIPLITQNSLKAVFKNYRNEGNYEAWYPVVSKDITEATFPGVSRTYVKLKDGTFTGGNLFIIKPLKFLALEKEIMEVYSLRKSPFKLAKLLGWGFMLKMLTRGLTLEQAEKKVEEAFGIKGKAFIFAYPEIAVDVDKPSDYEMVEKLLTS